MTPANYRQQLGLKFDPSSHQVDVFDWITNGRGHRVVKAVAGAGKSTTIVVGARLTTGSGLFLAFNKPIADELDTKLAGTEMVASTVHRHGFAAVRKSVGRVKLDTGKYKDRVKQLARAARDDNYLALGRSGRELTRPEVVAILDDGFPTAAISTLLDLARLNLLDPCSGTFGSDLFDLANHHNVETDGVPDMITQCVAKLMTWGWDNPQTVDFTDMVWLPTANGYAPAKYAWVFVDECQDISACHLELIRMSLMEGGRVLFVGDPRQAIYGFAGADSESFEKVVEVTRATTLPLSVCYRCPTAVLDVAREMCPEIEARPGAPTGIVRKAKRDEFVAEAREGDMVLCRVNAPLLGLCFALIAEGTSASVRGREIGKGLCKVVTDCSKRLLDFDTFGSRLEAWEDKQTLAARARYKDEDALATRTEYIEDQAECVRIILARSEAKSPAQLRVAIADLFTDDKPSVVLSSVHRAKGLEADRVFIAAPERLGAVRPGAQPWMVEQEVNLKYVAVTRARKELIWLEG